MRPLYPIIALVLVVAGVTGYFVSRKEIDTAKADSKLKAFAEREVGPVRDVTCPETKVEKGKSFECKVKFVAGTEASITVDMVDDKGDVKYYWTKPIAAAEKLSAILIEAVKAEKNKTATVDCGKGIVEIGAAGVRCTVVVDGQNHVAVFRYETKTKELIWNVQ